MLDSFRFHHIGVAVKSIEKTSAVYIKGGYVKSSVTFDPIQNVNICWLSKEGMPLIELLEPVDNSSPICKTLEKNGVTPYHTCYVVSDIESAVQKLRKMKYVIVSKAEKAVAIQNSRVCFLFHKDAGLIELVEAPAVITE